MSFLNCDEFPPGCENYNIAAPDFVLGEEVLLVPGSEMYGVCHLNINLIGKHVHAVNHYEQLQRTVCCVACNIATRNEFAREILVYNSMVAAVMRFDFLKAAEIAVIHAECWLIQCSGRHCNNAYGIVGMRRVILIHAGLIRDLNRNIVAISAFSVRRRNLSAACFPPLSLDCELFCA